MPSIFELTKSNRSIYLFDTVWAYSSEKIVSELLRMNQENKDPINIFINSPGGMTLDSLGIIDVIQSIEAPVNTIVLGLGASAASLITACGTKGHRYISPNSQMMIHEAAMQGFGYIDTRDQKFQKSLEWLESLNKRINKIYANATGKSFEEVDSIMSSKDDVWMSAEEAVEFGLVDQILTEEELAKIKLSEFKNIKLSEAFSLEENEGELKKVHLLKTCSLKDRGVEITKETLKALKENFDSNVRGQDISIDYTHDNDNGENKAGAWIKSIEIEGDNLFAMAELTPAAKEMVKNKEYKYLSVEIDPLYHNEEGKIFSNVLLGGTFTNRPAVKGLDPIKLSENINQNKIDMELTKEEIASIEAIKSMGVEVKDFHKSFAEIKSVNEKLSSENKEFSSKLKAAEKTAKDAEEKLSKIEAARVEEGKVQAVDALIEEGIVLPSQKEKVLKKFSSKSEIEDFYADVPAAIKVEAKGSGVVDGNDLEETRLQKLSEETGQSVEDIKKYGLKK